jgi:hypothetical protein
MGHMTGAKTTFQASVDSDTSEDGDETKKRKQLLLATNDLFSVDGEL